MASGSAATEFISILAALVRLCSLTLRLEWEPDTIHLQPNLDSESLRPPTANPSTGSRPPPELVERGSDLAQVHVLGEVGDGLYAQSRQLVIHTIIVLDRELVKGRISERGLVPGSNEPVGYGLA